jgi:hypothetical protein
MAATGRVAVVLIVGGCHGSSAGNDAGGADAGSGGSLDGGLLGVGGQSGAAGGAGAQAAGAGGSLGAAGNPGFGGTPAFGAPTLTTPTNGDAFVLDVQIDDEGNTFVLVGDGKQVNPTTPVGYRYRPLVEYSGLRCLIFPAGGAGAPSSHVLAQVPAPFFATGARMAVLAGGGGVVLWAIAAPMPPIDPATGMPHSLPAGPAQVYAAAYSRQNGWGTSQTLATGSLPVIQFDIAIDGGKEGDAIAVYRALDLDVSPLSARRFNRDLGWAAEESIAPMSSLVGIPGQGIAVGLGSQGKAMVLWNEGSAVMAASSTVARSWKISTDYVFSNNLTVGIPTETVVAAFDDNLNAVAAAYPSSDVTIGTPVAAVQVNVLSADDGWQGAADAVPLAAFARVSTLPPYGPSVAVAMTAGRGAVLAVGFGGDYRATDESYAATVVQNIYDSKTHSWGAPQVLDHYRRPVSLGVPSSFVDGVPVTLVSSANGDLALAYPRMFGDRLGTGFALSPASSSDWTEPVSVGPIGTAAGFPAIAIDATSRLSIAGSVRASATVLSWVIVSH